MMTGTVQDNEDRALYDDYHRDRQSDNHVNSLVDRGPDIDGTYLWRFDGYRLACDTCSRNQVQDMGPRGNFHLHQVGNRHKLLD